MIKILKFENVFGIHKLSGAKNLGKLNVIYAPNGTAKSSISDALDYISKEEDVSDVYRNNPAPSFQIDIDGIVCDENSYKPFNVVKYSGIEEYNLADSASFYRPLVISPSLQKKVNKSVNAIQKSIESATVSLLNAFPTKGKERGGTGISKVLKEAISIVAGTTDDTQLILKFILNFDCAANALPSKVTEEEFLKLVNQKASDTINNPAVNANLTEYEKIVKQSISSSILDDDFTIERLINLKNHLSEDKYFNDKKSRSLLINKIEYSNQADFDKAVGKEIDSMFGSDAVRLKMDECKKVLKKNAASSKFAESLLANPLYLSEVLNYKLFVNRLFVTILGITETKNIEVQKTAIIEEQKALETLKSSFDDSDNVISDIWNRYKTRFNFNKFDLDIKNRFDAVIGSDVPQFVKYIKGTQDEIHDPAEFRFSTGEIRSYNLINLVIEIEKMKIGGNPFTIVLDDAVDSFDYKNKYGIIDYLVDLKDDPNIQIIAFTHNFDFYRSLILAFGSGNVEQYFMYKDDNNDVTLIDTKSKNYYLQIAHFNKWRCETSIEKFLALIPFYRNLLQLQTNANNLNVKAIDKYLHYESVADDNENFINLLNAVSRGSISGYRLPSSLSNTDSYLKILLNSAQRICLSPGNETDLENKIVLGLFIRIFTERFLVRTILDSDNHVDSSMSIFMRTRGLLNQALSLSLIDRNEEIILLEGNVLAPSYVHANSFMYEPLIDVDYSPLVRVANELIQLNTKWPL